MLQYASCPKVKYTTLLCCHFGWHTSRQFIFVSREVDTWNICYETIFDKPTNLIKDGWATSDTGKTAQKIWPNSKEALSAGWLISILDSGHLTNDFCRNCRTRKGRKPYSAYLGHAQFCALKEKGIWEPTTSNSFMVFHVLTRTAKTTLFEAAVGSDVENGSFTWPM